MHPYLIGTLVYLGICYFFGLIRLLGSRASEGLGARLFTWLFSPLNLPLHILEFALEAGSDAIDLSSDD